MMYSVITLALAAVVADLPAYITTVSQLLGSSGTSLHWGVVFEILNANAERLVKSLKIVNFIGECGAWKPPSFHPSVDSGVVNSTHPRHP